MVKTVNIRALKDQLSAHLRDVQRGDIVLVTDRGRVVAELRQPTLHEHALDAAQMERERLIGAGVLRPGLPHDPSLYAAPSGVRVPASAIDAALDWTRGGDDGE